MSTDNGDLSVAKNKISNHNTSETKNQSRLDEDSADCNTTVDDYVSDYNATASMKEESMLDEEVPDHNKTASKEGESMLDEEVPDHNKTSSKESESMLDEVVPDNNTTASNEDEVMSNEEVPEDVFKADQSIFIEYVSDNNTTATSSSGDSVESKDRISCKDNMEMVEDIVGRLSQTNDSLPNNMSDMHLKSPDSPSGSKSHLSSTPKVNSSEQVTHSNDLKVNIKNTDISFDLDSSLYDQPSLSEKPAVIRNSRKSCAIQKTFIGYESDSSQLTSNPSTANSSEDEIIESDSDFSAASDLGSPIKEVNSSLSFVASSIPNSPYITKDKNLAPNLTLSPGRRIVPLRLRKSFVSPPNNAFALAMATSPIFAPVTHSPGVLSPPHKISRGSRSFSQEEDSPVKVRKTKRIVIVSDSEDSENE